MVVLCNVPLIRAEGGEEEQEAKVEHLVVKILTLRQQRLEGHLDLVLDYAKGGVVLDP